MGNGGEGGGEGKNMYLENVGWVFLCLSRARVFKERKGSVNIHSLRGTYRSSQLQTGIISWYLSWDQGQISIKGMLDLNSGFHCFARLY